MSTGLIVLVTIVAILGTATAASAQTAIASGERPFRFQFEQSKSPRGLAVQGYVYNALLAHHQRSVAGRQDRRERHTRRVRLGLGPRDVAAGGGCGYFSDIRQGDARSAGGPGALSGTPAEE